MDQQIARELRLAESRLEISDDLKYFEENVYPPFQERGFTFKEAYEMSMLHDIYETLQDIDDTLENLRLDVKSLKEGDDENP